MICPSDIPGVIHACGATYCPPTSNINAPGNFSVSVCTYSMVKRDNSSSQLSYSNSICEYTPQMCNYSCDFLLKNISSLPSTFPEKSTIGQVLPNSLQTRMFVGCVPGNLTTQRNEFKSMSEVNNPPTSNGTQLTGSLILPMLLALILLLKIKFV
ncbi:unnamed protein product [Mucor hiemalis]